ncbi:MAG: hypothetical protein V3V99_11210 [candidate division Zixibacteria bacterium]
METIGLKAQIEQLDPKIHRALRERLIACYRRQNGIMPNDNRDEPSKRETGHKPFIDQYDDLVIPFSSDRRFHWWNGGRSIEETIKEIEGKFKGSGEEKNDKANH